MRLRKRYCPIGLDLGAHSIKALQLRGDGESWEAVAAMCIARNEPGSELTRQELERTVDVLQRQGFIGNRVQVALQPAQTLTGSLELPARVPGVPMEQIALAEFCRVSKVEADAVVMSCWDLPAPARAGQVTYAMAVGCRRGEADAYLDLIESAGLDVQALDASGSAVARACAKLSGPDGQATILVDQGWTAATLSILKSGVVVYERRIAEAGLAALVASIAEACGATTGDVEYVIQRTGLLEDPAPVTDAAELETECRSRCAAHFMRAIEEFGQAFSYAAHRYPGSDAPGLLVCGGAALLPGLPALFERTLRAPVKIAAAADVVSCPESLKAAMTPAMVAATGLALFDPS